jgi:hypothetical protein
MREEAVGYSDEGPEDVTFRRLMSHDSPSRELHGLLPLETALLTQVRLACVRVKTQNFGQRTSLCVSACVGRVGGGWG